MLKIDIEKINKSFFSKRKQLDVYSKKNIGLTNPEGNLFSKYISKDSHVLDVGCGLGRTTKPISSVAEKVIGIDYSENMIQAARREYEDIDFRVMDATNLKFSDSVFDVVVFSYNGICCIYPEHQRFQSIYEIKRVLKKNGIFIYSVLNEYLPYSLSSTFNSLASTIVMGFSNDYKFHITKTGVMILYENSPEKEISLLQSFGFECIEQQPSELTIRVFGIKTKKPVWTYFVFRNLM